MKRLLPLLTLVAVLFTGCPDPRETVNFDTDPRILRGSWNFVLSNALSTPPVTTIAVEFTPTLDSESRYIVTASITLEGEVYALTGWVSGRDTNFVRPQFSIPPVAFMTLTGQTTGTLLVARFPVLYQSGGRWIFSGELSGMTKYWELEISRN